MRLDARALDARALAGAAGFIAAGWFTLCSLFVALLPQATARFFSYVLHIDLTGLARPLTWSSFLVGVLVVGLFAAVFVGLTGRLYNALAGSARAERTIVAPERTVVAVR